MKRFKKNFNFVEDVIEKSYKELGRPVTIYLKIFEIRVAAMATFYKIDLNYNNFELKFEY